ncbi:hypothetical protein EJB05_53463, partial [Eragrostis curvula]
YSHSSVLVSAGDDDDGRKKRGRTILKHIWDLPEGRKIVVNCNPLGQPIGKEGGILGKFLGTVARNGGYCPLDVNDWRNVKKNGGAETILQFIKALSEKNKISCGMRKTSHTADTKSYARWAEDLRQDDPEKKMPHRAKVFLATHKNRDKETNEHVAQLENIIDEHPELAETMRGKLHGRVTHYTKYLGKRNQDKYMAWDCFRSQSKVQCNLASQKNLLGEQDDETIKERHGAEENTNNDVDLFLSNQKRHDDANCKELSLEEGESSSPPFPADDDAQPEMSKRHGGAFEHTTSMTQNEVAGNRTTSRGTSKYICPRIKVGSVVLLKTAKYPNKETVAYATILSSNPEVEVGGVKIGNQFYKVRVNHVVSENEPLVRPMTGYRILGDVHAKGVPIAWPSIFVEMING